MNERKRGLGANSALALVGDSAVKASGFVLIVVAARGLTTVGFGILATALAAASVLSAVFDGGLSTLVARDGAREPALRRGILRAGLLVRVPLLLVAAGAGAGIGVWRGQIALALLTVGYGALGAASLGYLGLFRAGQNLALEAVQKLAVGLLGLAGVGLALLRPSATSMLVALASTQALGLALLVVRARRLPLARVRPRLLAMLRRSAPFAFMTLGTLVYYRAGTLVLAGVGSSAEVAVFTVASTIAFGALMLPNAITTGLLPRLSAIEAGPDQIRIARRALGWTLAFCVVLALVLGLSGPWLLPSLFGAAYRDAALPLGLLLVGDVLIGVSGVVGSVLVARGRLRPLVWQVGASLVVNLAANAALATWLGAVGAASATLLTELVALALLLAAAARAVPGLLHLRRLDAVPARPEAVSA